MLWLLFAARTVMAMQFQVVGALSPALLDRFGVGLGDIGLAIGLYFASGLVVALPGGSIAARYGERLVSCLSLALMAAGGALMAVTENWSVFLAGQLIAGAGGVVVNVSMTKMVTDQFQGKDIATALSLFINSWPVGIALSLILMPLIGVAFGATAAIAVIATLAAIMAVLVPWLYRSPQTTGAAQKGVWPDRHEMKIALSTGLIWGCFNAGVAVVFGFGTAYLAEIGVAPEAAARRVSLVLWSLAIVAPFGGWMSDRSRQPLRLIAAGLVLLMVLTIAVPMLDGSWWLMVAIGSAAGLVAGPVMSLPGKSLSAASRAIGMGLFFTVYYLAFLVTPPVAGWAADQQKSLLAAFVVGGLMHAVAIIGLWMFARLQRLKE